MNRIKVIREALKAADIDAAFLGDEVEVSWATGFTGDDSHCLITQSESLFYTDFRYEEQAHMQLDGYDIVITSFQERLLTAAKTIFGSASTVGIDFTRTSVSQMKKIEEAFEGISIKDISNLIDSLREIKTPDELDRQRKGAQITQNAFYHILKIIKPGISENDINAELLYYFHKNGAEPSFRPIIASGENSSMPHASVTGRKIKQNDFITMDFGVKYMGICTDFTRTIAVGGIEKDKRMVYNTVNNAQKAALNMLRPGITGKMADKAARDVIDNAGYRGCFGHGTGHGVGLEIHESPRLSVASDDVLKPGMVLTVEPGIYIPKEYGVRIEDMLLITEHGYENFYTADKELIII